MAIRTIGTTITDSQDTLGLSPVQVQKFLAVTDKFGTTINGGLVQTVLMLLREANSTTDTAGISGLQGPLKDLPAFWAGGTYAQALAGTAKSIIRHDGTAKFSDAEIEGKVTARSVVTGSGLNKVTLNEEQDNLLKFRHSNGVIAAKFGVIDGVSAMIWYDESGAEIWRAGKDGIVYVTNVPESWKSEYMYRLTSLDGVTTLTSSNHATIRTALSSLFCVDRKDETNIGIDFPLVAGNLVYLYSKGNNAQSNANAVYEGYHTSATKLTSNWIPTGWYVRREYIQGGETVHLSRYVSGRYDKDYMATLSMNTVSKICPLDMAEPN